MNDCTYNSQYCDLVDEDESITNNNSTLLNDTAHDKTPDNVVLEQDDDELNAVVPPPETAELEKDEEDEALWCIDDDTLFHPLGLINHGDSDSKSVFVTWSENYLLNFVFKKSQKTKRTKLTKVRIDASGETIKQILILELNTLLLMQSGRVYHFASVKQMHPVRWLDGVRCISTARGGFSVIRVVAGTNVIRLELYDDVMDIEHSESTVRHSFDITFDEMNLFNCSWQDERFTLHSQAVDAENREFLEYLMCNRCKLTEEHLELHFFTVSGNVFALIAANTSASETDSSTSPDYHIQLCASFAANIEFIKVLTERQLFLIFLQSGNIDMWYKSWCGLSRTTHCTGSQFLHYDFATSNNCFYYTDGEKVAQLKFHYDSSTERCVVQESSKAVYGMLACTWMQSIQQLICLSNNNIFYQLVFDADTAASQLDADSSNDISLNELYELTPAKMSRLLRKAQMLHELQQMPNELHNCIEREFLKQQLLAVATKLHVYCKQFEVRLEFRQHMQPQSPECLVIYTQSNCLHSAHSIYALVYLKMSKNPLLKAALWQLHLCYAQNCHNFCVTPSMLQHEVCIVVPLVWQCQQLLPTFELLCNSFLSIDHNFVVVSLRLPLQQQEAAQFKPLFNVGLACMANYAPTRLEHLMARFKCLPAPALDTDLTWSLQLPKGCSFCDIKKIFGQATTPVDVDEAILVLNFLTVSLKISYSASDTSISLVCVDAVVLYYAKFIILQHLKELQKNEVVEVNKANDDVKRAILMQNQCEIERCYGNLLQMNENERGAADTLHLENLQRIYTKLRKDFNKSYI